VNVLEYLTSKHLDFKLVKSSNGLQAKVRTCPFCKNNDSHFYISVDTGQYKCHHGSCGEEGGLFTLKRFLGDITEVKPVASPTILLPPNMNDMVEEAHDIVYDTPEAIRYMAKRGWSKSALEYFKIGVSFEDNLNWLWYPYIDRNGRVVNVKKRTLPPAAKAFKRIEGGLSSLFNEAAIYLKYDEIILTEGESDCIAVWTMGYPNVVGVSLGAGAFKSEWVDQLDRFAKIYIVYDSDIAGQTGASKVATRLGIERCYNVLIPPPYKDANEFLMGGNKIEQFKQLLDNAKKFDVDSVKPLSGVIKDAIFQLTNSDDTIKLTLPGANVNRLCGGFQAGDLITIGGKPGVGKTSLALCILYHFAFEKKIPCMLFELEMRPERLLPRFMAMHFRRNSAEAMSYEELSQGLKDFSEIPLYIAYKYDKPTWDSVSDTIRMSIRRYGIQFLVFDNLHFLCRDIREQTKEVSVMVQNFKLLAEELNIPTVLIARPTKMAVNAIVRGVNLKDSADIEGDSDTILIIDRKRKDTSTEATTVFEEQTMILCDKARYAGGGVTYLRAIDEQARFEEMYK
jgi:KaiC/GvpD/RAD55 family RecA-like ATPase